VVAGATVVVVEEVLLHADRARTAMLSRILILVWLLSLKNASLGPPGVTPALNVAPTSHQKRCHSAPASHGYTRECQGCVPALTPYVERA
jgi:hypothetical protein